MNPARIFSSSSFIEAGSTIRWRVYGRERERPRNEAFQPPLLYYVVWFDEAGESGRSSSATLSICMFNFVLWRQPRQTRQNGHCSRERDDSIVHVNAHLAYIYYKRRRNDRERLASPWRSIENRGKSIVEFWYHRFLTGSTGENNYLIYRANHSKKQRTEAMQFRRRINNMDN